MADKKVSIKHVQIDKSQSKMLIVIVVAVIVSIFALFGVRAMIVKGAYQRKALHARRDVAAQLKQNYTAAQTLLTQYKVFNEQNPNVLGGSVSGGGNLDGDNSRIVLDALPSNYDAPALATSLEKVILGRGVAINTISVTDDPTANNDQPETNPQSKPVAFSFTGTSNYTTAAQLMQDFERSIRPFDVSTLEITGSDNNLRLTVGMTTYYQPAKSLDLKATKVIQ